MNKFSQLPEPRVRGELLNEGKTKKIFRDLTDPTACILESKDDITAGDGAKHDIVPNKAELANKTTCNVFRLLKASGVPVAFNEQVDERSFSAPHRNMVLLEVVARREAHGSYLKRYPHIPKGTIFPRLVVEYFLKTKDKRWKDIPLVCDDPHAVYVPEKDAFELYDVKQPFIGQTPFVKVYAIEVFPGGGGELRLQEIDDITRKTFLVLEKAWQLQGRRLVDFKIEFGLNYDKLDVADVIDNDSWRLLKDGRYEDKQVYRDGGTLSEVAANYTRVADLTERFELPRQSVVVWRGSEKDDAVPVCDALEKLGVTDGINVITCSMHKKAAQGLDLLRQIEQEVPNSVIIAMIGMSNGAGPTLSAHTTLPVINYSPSAEKFPNDIWSSLRMPSEVPCVTALSASGAAHAALNILAARHPGIYAGLRIRLEDRFVNTIAL